MKANELLIQQHREVEDLFEQLENAEGSREKRDLFEKLAANLVGHDAIEREIFYPACEQELGQDDDVLGEALVEHGVVEFCLFRADEHKNDEAEFDKYITVLKEVVEHHVKEEERELLPKAKRRLDRGRLEQLGATMEARFDEALETDFRRPLRENLDQVLAGRTKTQKKPARVSKAKPSTRVSTRSATAPAQRRPAKAKKSRRAR